MYEEIKAQLEKSPRGRERKNKNAFIAWILEKKYMPSMGLNLKQLENVIVDAGSYDRAWRKVLQEEPHLRGTDYGDKEVLEQEKMLELGYQPGISGLNKKVKDL